MKASNAVCSCIPASTPNLAAISEECRLLTLADLCRQMQVSMPQLQKLRRAGKILRPTVTLGRSPRFLSDEFFAWMRAGCPDAAYWTWSGKGQSNGRKT